MNLATTVLTELVFPVVGFRLEPGDLKDYAVTFDRARNGVSI